MDLLFASFSTYYGLDWISMGLGFLGMYLLTHQKRIGCLLTIGAAGCGIIVAFVSMQYGFVIANALNMIIAFFGYFHWAPVPVYRHIKKKKKP